MIDKTSPEYQAASETYSHAWAEVYLGLDVVYAAKIAGSEKRETDFYKTKKIAEIAVLLQRFAELETEITEPKQAVLKLLQETSMESVGYSSDPQDQHFINDVTGLCLANWNL